VQRSHWAAAFELLQQIPVIKSCVTTANRSALLSIERRTAFVSSCLSARLDQPVFEGLSKFNKTFSRKSPLRISPHSSFGFPSCERASPTSSTEWG